MNNIKKYIAAICLISLLLVVLCLRSFASNPETNDDYSTIPGVYCQYYTAFHFGPYTNPSFSSGQTIMTITNGNQGTTSVRGGIQCVAWYTDNTGDVDTFTDTTNGSSSMVGVTIDLPSGKNIDYVATDHHLYANGSYITTVSQTIYNGYDFYY